MGMRYTCREGSKHRSIYASIGEFINVGVGGFIGVRVEGFINVGIQI